MESTDPAVSGRHHNEAMHRAPFALRFDSTGETINLLVWKTVTTSVFFKANIIAKGGPPMQDKRNLQKKMQEQIDCFAGTDYLTKLGAVKNEPDKEQAPLQWLALAILYGINENAKKIKIEKNQDGTNRLVVEFRDFDLPSPGDDVVDGIFEAMRQMTHIEDDKGKISLSVGVRDSSLDLEAKIKKQDDKEKISLKFPGK